MHHLVSITLAAYTDLRQPEVWIIGSNQWDPAIVIGIYCLIDCLPLPYFFHISFACIRCEDHGTSLVCRPKIHLDINGTKSWGCWADIAPSSGESWVGFRVDRNPARHGKAAISFNSGRHRCQVRKRGASEDINRLFIALKICGEVARSRECNKVAHP